MQAIIFVTSMLHSLQDPPETWHGINSRHFISITFPSNTGWFLMRPLLTRPCRIIGIDREVERIIKEGRKGHKNPSNSFFPLLIRSLLHSACCPHSFLHSSIFHSLFWHILLCQNKILVLTLSNRSASPSLLFSFFEIDSREFCLFTMALIATCASAAAEQVQNQPATSKIEPGLAYSHADTATATAETQQRLLQASTLQPPSLPAAAPPQALGLPNTAFPQTSSLPSTASWGTGIPSATSQAPNIPGTVLPQALGWPGTVSQAPGLSSTEISQVPGLSNPSMQPNPLYPFSGPAPAWGFTRKQLDARFALEQQRLESNLAAIRCRTKREDKESLARIAVIQARAVTAAAPHTQNNKEKPLGEISPGALLVASRYPRLPKAEIARIFTNKFWPENLYKLRHLKGWEDKDCKENVTIENGQMKVKRVTETLQDFGTTWDIWCKAFINYSMIMVDFFGSAAATLFRALFLF